MSETSTAPKVPFYKDRANLFVVQIIGLYLVWKLIHAFVLNHHGVPVPLWSNFVLWLGSKYAIVTSGILNAFGERTVNNGPAVIYLANSFKNQDMIVYIVEHCLAIPATVIFIGAISLFPGSWKHKLWFIPLGVLLVSLINLIRLLLTCIAFEYFTENFFKLNHSFIYVVLTYALIMGLIVWWTKKFGRTKAA